MNVKYVEAAVERSEEWINRLALAVGRPVRAPLPKGDFRWRHPDETPEVLLVAKSVRMVSALAAAWRLAEEGFTTEAASLLRLVGDFSSEIDFIGEGVLAGRFTRAQKDFIDQFFTDSPRDLEGFLAEEKQYFVSRKQIAAAGQRLAENAGVDAKRLQDIASFLSFAYNKYAHGDYDTAMELFSGEDHKFHLQHKAGRTRVSTQEAVAGKATECLNALRMAALSLGAADVDAEIRSFLKTADPQVFQDPE